MYIFLDSSCRSNTFVVRILAAGAVDHLRVHRRYEASLSVPGVEIESEKFRHGNAFAAEIQCRIYSVMFHALDLTYS